jgi:hypothetical protein
VSYTQFAERTTFVASTGAFYHHLEVEDHAGPRYFTRIPVGVFRAVPSEIPELHCCVTGLQISTDDKGWALLVGTALPPATTVCWGSSWGRSSSPSSSP